MTTSTISWTKGKLNQMRSAARMTGHQDAPKFCFTRRRGFDVDLFSPDFLLHRVSSFNK